MLEVSQMQAETDVI